jgi:hypothetical protein
MILEPWLVPHAAELADQAVTHIQVAAASVQNEIHLLFQEITDVKAVLHTPMGGFNGGCHVGSL